jgi:fructose/tagatose bisphosphate aldolase
MALESISSLMKNADAGGYAIGYFESWDLASLQGVLDAAEETRSPTIIGFNGDFMSNPARQPEDRLHLYAAMGRVAAESAKVPCGFLFNECSRDSWTIAAIAAGFNMVGVAAGESTHEQYQRRVAAIVEKSHQRGIAVEAEVDELPCGASGGTPTGGTPTDPKIAKNFISQTQIDLLGVSVGNVHISVDGQAGLDLDRLAAIKKQVLIPLVLHGGSGIDAASLQAAVKLGVRKVNYGTYLKQHCLSALRHAVNNSKEVNPHMWLGMGSDQDLLDLTRKTVREAVLERIGLLGCCGKA